MSIVFITSACKRLKNLNNPVFQYRKKKKKESKKVAAVLFLIYWLWSCYHWGIRRYWKDKTLGGKVWSSLASSIRICLSSSQRDRPSSGETWKADATSLQRQHKLDKSDTTWGAFLLRQRQKLQKKKEERDPEKHSHLSWLFWEIRCHSLAPDGVKNWGPSTKIIFILVGDLEWIFIPHRSGGGGRRATCILIKDSKGLLYPIDLGGRRATSILIKHSKGFLYPIDLGKGKQRYFTRIHYVYP